LKKISHVFEIKQMLTDILTIPVARTRLLQEICSHEGLTGIIDGLMEQEPKVLANMLIEGIVLERNSLTSYLSPERFLLRPLHNLFFSRDVAMWMNGRMLIGRMVNSVSEMESMIMEAIFNFHPSLDSSSISPITSPQGIPVDSHATLEGGDFLVVR